MSIFRIKKNTLFDAALSKVSALTIAIESGEKPYLEQNKFFQIVKDDPKSPMIMGMGGNKHLIYYPANSTPYLHTYDTQIKYVEILAGEIFDKLTDKKYIQGDRFKIYPGQEIEPYTKDAEAYVRVCVSSSDTIWERVCN